MRPGAGTTDIAGKIWYVTNTIFGVAGLRAGTGFDAPEICRKELLRSGDVDVALPHIEAAVSNALIRISIEDRIPLHQSPAVQLGFGFLRSGKPEFRLTQIILGTNSQGVTISIVRDTTPPWRAWWMAFPTVWSSVSEVVTEKMWDEKGGFGGLETVIRLQIKAAGALGIVGYPIIRMSLGPDGYHEAPIINSPE